MPLHQRLHAGRLSGALLALVVLAWFAETSCRTTPTRGGVELPTPPELIARSVRDPSIRIGVVVGAGRVSVAADSGVVLWELGAQGAGQAQERVQRATFLALPGVAASSTWRVQVASLSDEAAARALAQRIQHASGMEASVAWNAASSTHQVRAGKWATREEARAAVERLARSGFPGAWPVTQSDLPDAEGVRVSETGRAFRVALVVPAAGDELLSIDGAAYRGVIEVRGAGAGGVVAVNVVNVEDYLRGVVPNEMSPQAFPQLEALKAQAVAARTYALRNRGQYAARGFDLCATPSCQVYRGQSSEQALTDRAVAETRGVVATYAGEPIKALYTSTCGGHTEDGDKVFPGSASPYLRGVVCAAERSEWRLLRSVAKPSSAPAREPVAKDSAPLVALGVMDARDVGTRTLGSADLERAVSRLLAALSRTGCPTEASEALGRRGAFFAYLVGRLCWDERAQRFLREGDLAYLLQVEDRADFPSDAERMASALLIQEEILAPDAENRLRPQASLTTGEAIALLAQTLRRIGGPALVTVEFVDASDGQLVVKQDGQPRTLTLDAAAALVRNVGGNASVASELLLIPGERLRVVERNGRVQYVESMQSPLGAAADRGSQYYRWDVRLTPADVAQGVAKYGDVGRVRDLVPRKHGVSGRVVELAVVGTKGEVLLKGMEVRSALGLRENLFVIEREIATDGSVQRFVISGRGWGHGVGLCQVGASGLARAGKGYEDILRHYYAGIALETRY